MTIPLCNRAIAILVLASVICIAKPCYAEVNLLGVTLGKPLTIRECRKDKRYSIESYDFSDKECYKILDYSKSDCFTKLEPNVSFYAQVYIILENECDRNSNVIRLEVTIRPKDFDKVLALMVNKFGEPSKTEDSVVHNRMGASFPQTEVYWTVENCELYLARFGGEIDEGSLIASHPIYLNQQRKVHQKDFKTDASNF